MGKTIVTLVLIVYSILFIDVYSNKKTFAAEANGQGGLLKVRIRDEGRKQYLDIIVSKVLNGSMLRLENSQILRLIGIDTPEVDDSNKMQFDAKVSGIPVEVLKAMGNEAMFFLKKMIEGKRVRIEFDKKEKDNYGNLLGYVFLIPEDRDDNEIFVNVEIVKKGYSYLLDTFPNNRYLEIFKESYEQSKENYSQIWRQWLR